MENESEMAEEDKAMKDNTISTLREEIRHQEQLIAKLQKEKKGAGESRQKTEEEIQAMEDRSNHLCKVKGKLEQGLDECELNQTSNHIAFIYKSYNCRRRCP